MRTEKNAMPDLLPFLNLVLDLPIDMLKLCYSRREAQLKSPSRAYLKLGASIWREWSKGKRKTVYIYIERAVNVSDTSVSKM